jgi:hypothetical protein
VIFRKYKWDIVAKIVLSSGDVSTIQFRIFCLPVPYRRNKDLMYGDIVLPLLYGVSWQKCKLGIYEKWELKRIFEHERRE